MEPVPSVSSPAPPPLILCYFFRICGSSDPSSGDSGSSSFFDNFAATWQEQLDAYANFPTRIDRLQSDFDAVLASLKDANIDPVYQAALDEIARKLKQLTEAMKHDFESGLVWVPSNAKLFIKDAFESYYSSRDSFMQLANALKNSGSEAKKLCAMDFIDSIITNELSTLETATNIMPSLILLHGSIYNQFKNVLDLTTAAIIRGVTMQVETSKFDTSAYLPSDIIVL
ncbi:uncharacterized protein LOC129752390 [Uranotaenia lowii]|uniref:uncharacterized protein LOC129752390 n=1 Tax=Uranotaenia lowii TaxID=190385 RepID=UPI0024798C52|nr:uncharacterized protein LOC129752390 [Uranotaenia lowii]